MENTHPTWQISRGRELQLDRAVLIGILNVTPDSFSDGGRYADAVAATEAALRLIDEGAQVIDVGGESTRPGAQRVDAGEQRRRVLPVIERLRATSDVAISIDTTLAEVAQHALDAGATIINDVAAGREDARLFELAAERGCGLILMHRLRPPEQDSYSTQYAAHTRPEYADVVEQVAQFLDARAREAMRAGVDSASIVVDPGLGFGKTAAQNHKLIARINEIASLGWPVLCAASRKSFLDPTGDIEPRHRVAGSIAVAAAMHERGVRLFRVHDVATHRDALAVMTAIEAAATRGRSDPLRS